MTTGAESIHHADENLSNLKRDSIASSEPKTQRTYTPSQAVLARSAGVYHWTPEGRRLYDFSSGVLVANLGHNPESWMKRFSQYMGWRDSEPGQAPPAPQGFFSALPMNAYNAITEAEAEANRRLIQSLQNCPGGARLGQVLWAASGSEAIQKALWAALTHQRERPTILATRHGFHGKKGLAGAVSGSESDHERDARVRFISFPMTERDDVLKRNAPFDPAPYLKELDALWKELGTRIGSLITEPYLGSGGSYHPPREYLQLLQRFCRDRDVIFILDEVQSNFGRTGRLFAFETYGLEPDIVVLGKGLGNGVPVAAAVGRADVFAALEYGDGSDTWSANPLGCAAVLATLDEFSAHDVPGAAKRSSAIIEQGLVRLKELPFIANVRGELGGMVWGLETRDWGRRTAREWANAGVLACYRGQGEEGIHLLGPLAQKVIRIAPPLVITETEARDAVALMFRLLASLAREPHGTV
jgi:4-aminobutyrate aminotransferase-like enzyme